MNIEQLRAIDRDLKNRNEYVKYNKKDYEPKEGNLSLSGCTFLIIALFFGCICFLLVQDGESLDFGEVFAGTIILPWAISSILYSITIPKSQNEELKKLKANIVIHNGKYFRDIWLREQIKDYENSEKIVTILNERSVYEKLFVDDKIKNLHHVRLSWNTETGNSTKTIKSCKYSEVLKYEVIDKTTSKQTATSTTSSNSGKALGGAIVGELLFDEAAAGAVVGASGKRTTNTTYETTYSYNYDVNIYLDRLNDSIIRINTRSKDKVSEIVSVLEYILNSKV